MHVNPAELSPAAWLAVVKPKAMSMPEAELFMTISAEAARRFELHQATPLGSHLTDVFRDLGIKIRRPTSVACRGCGETVRVN